MTGPNTSGRAQADHYRELALWTSDERTRHILLEMAREMEAAAILPTDEGVLRAVPRSLS
jgi:hypothetical protein